MARQVTGPTAARQCADPPAAPAYVVLERHNRDSASGWRIEDEYQAPVMQPFLSRYTEETRIEDFTVLRRRDE